MKLTMQNGKRMFLNDAGEPYTGPYKHLTADGKGHIHSMGSYKNGIKTGKWQYYLTTEIKH